MASIKSTSSTTSTASETNTPAMFVGGKLYIYGNVYHEIKEEMNERKKGWKEEGRKEEK